MKTLYGDSIPFDVESSNTISSLKQKIQDKKRIPKVQQRLIFAGKTLYNNLTVTEAPFETEQGKELA